MMDKDYLLKGIKYMEDLPPSKWNEALVMMIKTKWLPRFKKFVSGEKEISEVAEEIFNNKSEGGLNPS